jgi:hypothetical protein
MVGFSTDQVKALQEFATPIPHHLRDRFLQELAHELRTAMISPATASFSAPCARRATSCRPARCGSRDERQAGAIEPSAPARMATDRIRGLAGYGLNDGLADATFEDWGLARATAEILNAVLDGRLAPPASLL